MFFGLDSLSNEKYFNKKKFDLSCAKLYNQYKLTTRGQFLIVHSAYNFLDLNNKNHIKYFPPLKLKIL